MINDINVIDWFDGWGGLINDVRLDMMWCDGGMAMGVLE